MDSVPNGAEDRNGTDKFDLDSDDDFIPDGVEWGDPAGQPRDTDGDGIIDPMDGDSDADGASDLEEAGDTDLTTPPIDTNNNGLPDYRDPDQDRDTISDADDNCVLTPNTAQGDRDADGVGDLCEKCPDNKFVTIRLNSAEDADCAGGNLDVGSKTISLQGGGGCATVAPGGGTASGAWTLLSRLAALGVRRR